MRFDGHISTTKTKVREGALSRHTARRFPNKAIYAISAANGFPRLWAMTNDVVLDSFQTSVTKSTAAPPELLTDAYRHCQQNLADRCNQLIEHHPPDASVLFLMIASGVLHTLSSCTGRAYVFREGKAQRLTPREYTTEGLLHADASRSSTDLHPNDLVIAGSATAFSAEAVDRVTSVLKKAPLTSPPVIATLLTEPPTLAGVGAAAVVLRVS